MGIIIQKQMSLFSSILLLDKWQMVKSSVCINSTIHHSLS